MNTIKYLMTVAFVFSLCLAGLAQADLMHRYDFTADPNDRVGTADLTVNGGASIVDGELVLPGGGTRTNNASATGAALAELAATINGTDTLTIEAWFTQTSGSNWSKVFMAGKGADLNYMDITPRRGNAGNVASCSFNDGNPENTAILPGGSQVVDGTEYYVAAIWNETNDSLSIVLAEAGNPASAVSTSTGLAGRDLASLVVNEFYLGSAVQFGDGDFNGKINEFRIYNEALSAGTIAKNIELGADDMAAVLVSPADGAAQVNVDENLKWQASAISSKPIVNYDVYLGTEETAVADATKSDAEYQATVAVAGGVEEYEPGTLTTNLDYFWRIDQVIDDGVTDPNTIKGAVWQFDTKTVPFFSGQPVNQEAKDGQDVTFSVMVESATAVTFEWFKDGVAGAIVDDDVKYDIVSDALSSSLTVHDKTSADAGSYYCVATNAAGPKASELAELISLSLLYHWPLDGDGAEANGTGFDGTLEGGAKFTLQGTEPNDVASVVGSGSLSLDGVDDFMNIVGDVPLPQVGATPGFTVTCWVRPNNLSNPLQGIIGKFGTDTASENDDAFTIATATPAYGQTDGIWLSIADGVAANWASWTAAGPEVFIVDQWRFIAFVYSANNDFDLYIDGSQAVDYNGHSLGFPGLEGDLRFGHKPESINNVGDVENFFNGRIDDVKIYNYVLDKVEIANAYVTVRTEDSVCVEQPEFDQNDDCKVNLADFAVFAQSWMECFEYPTCY